MDKRLKPLLALVISVFMSVSTMTNMYTVRADDEVTQEEPIAEETQTEENEYITDDYTDETSNV